MVLSFDVSAEKDDSKRTSVRKTSIFGREDSGMGYLFFESNMGWSNFLLRMEKSPSYDGKTSKPDLHMGFLYRTNFLCRRLLLLYPPFLIP